MLVSAAYLTPRYRYGVNVNHAYVSRKSLRAVFDVIASEVGVYTHGAALYVAAIAERINLSVRTVLRALGRLRGLGVVRTVKPFGCNSRDKLPMDFYVNRQAAEEEGFLMVEDSVTPISTESSITPRVSPRQPVERVRSRRRSSARTFERITDEVNSLIREGRNVVYRAMLARWHAFREYDGWYDKQVALKLAEYLRGTGFWFVPLWQS